MRISTTLALAATLALAGACKKDKKKEDPGPAQPTGSGSAGATASGSGSAPAPVAVKPLEGEALAKSYVDCAALINAGETDKFVSTCVADNFKGRDASMGMDYTKAELASMFKDMKVGFPDGKMSPQLVLVNGRSIAAVMLHTGTNTGPLKGPDGTEMPKTDKKIGVMFFHRLKFDDANKATEEWGISDMQTFGVQLGQTPPDAKARPAMDKGLDGAPIIVAAANDDKEKANLAAVQKGNDAFNAKNVGDIMATMTDDVVESDLADTDDKSGKATVQKGTEMFMKAFPDGKIEAKEVWAAGDYVVQIVRFTGTNDGPLGPLPKTGKKIDVELAEVMQMKDGKVAKIWRFRDNMSFAKQLGLMPEPGAEPAKEPVAKPKEK